MKKDTMMSEPSCNARQDHYHNDYFSLILCLPFKLSTFQAWNLSFLKEMSQSLITSRFFLPYHLPRLTPSINYPLGNASSIVRSSSSAGCRAVAPAEARDRHFSLPPLPSAPARDGAVVDDGGARRRRFPFDFERRTSSAP